jgi:hypothetical protein
VWAATSLLSGCSFLKARAAPSILTSQSRLTFRKYIKEGTVGMYDEAKKG